MTQRDFRPLSAEVSNADLSVFRRQNAFGTGLLVKVFIAVIVVIIGAMMTIFTLDSARSTAQSGGIPQGVVFAVIIVGVGSAFLVVGVWSSRLAWKRRYRISQFASANGMAFAMRAGSPSYPGAIFHRGSNQAITEQLFNLGAKPLDIGNYRYTTGSGKNRKTHNWGYVAIKLDRMLPHMVLDARSNNFIVSNLPTTFARDQVLSLEGDFDRYFRLYCPKQYERDALYVFTPDLMVRLIDEAAKLDVEIVDDWMLLYSSQPFDLADPTVVAGLFRVIDTVGDKARDRTERYADDKMAGFSRNAGSETLGSRMSLNMVAPSGQRLAKGVPVAGLVVLGVFVIVWAINFLPLLRGF